MQAREATKMALNVLKEGRQRQVLLLSDLFRRIEKCSRKGEFQVNIGQDLSDYQREYLVALGYTITNRKDSEFEDISWPMNIQQELE